jgi:hypothetical protein
VQRSLTLGLLVCLVLSVQLRAGEVTWAAAAGRYIEAKISLDLQNADLGDVLRLIATASGRLCHGLCRSAH